MRWAGCGCVSRGSVMCRSMATPSSISAPKTPSPSRTTAAHAGSDPPRNGRAGTTARNSSPRVGQEVVVSFLDGDPDRPIIANRVYNADKGTTNLPFPDKSVKDLQLKLPFPKDASDKDTETETATDLPATARFDLRFSGIKTASIPTNEKDEDDQEKPILPPRFNLLRFDDTRNQEQYLIRSQGRLDITAYNHRYETIGRNRNLTVGGKKITPPPKEIGGDYITKIFRHYHLHVGDPEFPTQSGNRVTKLEQSDKLFVKKDSQLDSGTYSAVTGNYYLHVSGRPGSGGGKRDTIIDDKDSLLVKADLNQMISGNWSTALKPNSDVGQVRHDDRAGSIHQYQSRGRWQFDRDHALVDRHHLADGPDQFWRAAARIPDRSTRPAGK